MEDYLNIARRIFDGTRYKASDEDVKRLADNMALLARRGLGKLNKRLISAKKHSKIFETIAEHNFAVILVSQHCSSSSISYEPEIGPQRPLDFKVEIGNIIYWIQMRDLQKLARENRQDKIIQQIKKEAKEIKVGKFFSCMLSDDFKEGCLTELINFLKDRAASAGEGERVLFTSRNSQKAKIEFWSPPNINLLHLTCGIAGDLVAVELTGQTKEQMKQSLLNAAGAFNWGVDQRNINLIVMEADNKDDIDICDALFGTEYDEFSSDGYLGWNRKDDGLLREYDFSQKVAGVIAIKRKEKWHPVSDYHIILYMNDSFKHLLEDIKKLLSIDMVVYYYMRPPMGQDDFACGTE
ncbi:MAG: hypothetical protein A2Y81_07435 [Nitrospirae bacterium RBG_13_43_8]|nr:MAG: hypothetical protein A2Y81_07435 [Nitrospirae bacterium RBG_13_43_8]